jgi:hypothetical protein
MAPIEPVAITAAALQGRHGLPPRRTGGLARGSDQTVHGS